MASLNIIQWKCQAWPLQKKEKSNLSKRKGLEVQLRKIYAEFEEKLLTILWSFSTIDNLFSQGWSVNSFKISEKLPGCQYSMNFLSISVAFYSFIRSVDLWFIVCFVLGLGYCPMSHVLYGVFLNVLALPLSIGTCSSLGMLGIALTAWSIKFPWLVFVVVVVVFFYLCSTCIIVGFGYVVGRAGEGGEGRGGRVLGVNIVKCRNSTT